MKIRLAGTQSVLMSWGQDMGMTCWDALPAVTGVNMKFTFDHVINLQAIMLVHGHDLSVMPAIKTESLIGRLNTELVSQVGYFAKTWGQSAISNL